MSDQQGYKQDKTYVRETRTTERSGGSLALIVGGLVVAVAFILWLVFGRTEPVASTAPASDTNVTVETPAAPADTTTNVTIDPAPEAAAPVETAPAEPAPETATPDAAAPDATDPAPAAPADGTTAPANP